MKRRSFLERAAQWVAAGTAALVVKEAPAAPAAPPLPVRPDPEKLSLPAKHAQRLKEGDLVYLDSNGTVSPPAFNPDAECWKKTYTAHETALGFKISKEAAAGDVYGVYERFTRELGKAQKHTQEIQALSIFGG